jgi:hypothetical protein
MRQHVVRDRSGAAGDGKQSEAVVAVTVAGQAGINWVDLTAVGKFPPDGHRLEAEARRVNARPLPGRQVINDNHISPVTTTTFPHS